MKNDVSDQMINQLYQQRKKSTELPTHLETTILVDKLTHKVSQTTHKKHLTLSKILILLGISGMFSLATFAMMHYLLSPTAPQPKSKLATTAVTLIKTTQLSDTKLAIKDKTKSISKHHASKALPPLTKPVSVPAVTTINAIKTVNTKVKVQLNTLHSVLPRTKTKNTVTLTLLEKKIPKYPYQKTQKTAPHTVKLSYSINAQGKVQNIKVISSNPTDDYSRSAIKALKQWRYQVFNNNDPQWQQTNNIVEFNFSTDK